jgi:hypothetical protein
MRIIPDAIRVLNRSIDRPAGQVNCVPASSWTVVDVLAQLHAPRSAIIGVFESGYEKICQFSTNGSLRSTSLHLDELPTHIRSFEDGVQAGFTYLRGIEDYAVAAAQHDLEKARLASVQILERPAGLIGSDVVNDAGQPVAELRGFAVNTADNSLHAVLEVGGFLGLGAKEVALDLDQMRFNNEQQLMIERPTADRLLNQESYTGLFYEPIDLPRKRNTITTVPTSESLAYLFASSDSSQGRTDFPTFQSEVNKYQDQIATCLYRFYSRMSTDQKQDGFDCFINEKYDQLDMSVDFNDNKYRLVIFRRK